MNTEAIENILHQVASSEQLIHIATIILIGAAVVFVVGLIFKAIRLICILAALVICLSSFGVFTKAQTKLEEKIGEKIPLTQITEVIEDLKNGVDLDSILDSLTDRAD